MLIGISGSAGAGKDTLAGFFCNQYGFMRYSYAQPIKDACRVMFGWNDRHLYGDLKEMVDPFFGFSPRHAMQTLGTDWGRVHLRSDLWVKIAEKFILHNEHVVIPDVRFDNEAEHILTMGGILINIQRPGHRHISLSGHASEQGLSKEFMDKSLIFINDGSLDKMDRFAKDLMTK